MVTGGVVTGGIGIFGTGGTVTGGVVTGGIGTGNGGKWTGGSVIGPFLGGCLGCLCFGGGFPHEPQCPRIGVIEEMKSIEMKRIADTFEGSMINFFKERKEELLRSEEE
ncbi:hypothetical protein HS088_TW04G01567 [Tripterygium wilfordii]|uniref:Uncharacterized protein n=1 Tax=Tripterygium wilfordii TaxID=458696 RepID=A0A7J7DTF8_TRIWF|nr:hypothetical protein HS088_TW04G01567 [Tripterygium wilfordii]